MSNTLPGTPGLDYDFGQEFDYSLWTPGTTVDLVNVPWNNDYRDVVKFTSSNALDTYIDGLAPAGIKVNQLSYVKPGEPVRINIPHNRAHKYNYLRANNPLQPIGGDVDKSYYYFILDTRYVAPNTTELILQLDIWQTYIYNVTIGRCYVERGHIGIANTKQMDHYGRDYLTVPEGLDTGADYRVITKQSREIVGFDATTGTSDIDVLVISTIDLLADPGTVADPVMKVAPASKINGLPSGAGFYMFDSVDHFRTWVGNMKDYPWVTQGIISITAVPKMARYGVNVATTGAVPKHLAIVTPFPVKHNFFINWRGNSNLLSYLTSRYSHLKKFLTAPYMLIEMTTWSGTPIVLRPESWQDPSAFVMERCNYIPPNQRVQFIPRRYNSSGQKIDYYAGFTEEQIDAIPGMSDTLKKAMADLGDDYGDYLDVMTMIADFPAMPLMNSGAINYLASNAHSIAYQRQSADWSQQRAITSARAQYDIISGSIGANTAQARNTIDAAWDTKGNVNRTIVGQAVVSGIADVATGAIGGGAFGGGATGAIAGGINGAVNGAAGAINAGIQAASNDEQFGINSRATWGSTNIQNRQTRLMNDTNNQLANWAARGDYANEIAGINAKVQDAAMIQPSVSGQFGGDAANLAYYTMEISLRWKLIDAAALRVIGEYWLRYGYAIRASISMPKEFMVMTKFTYWKLTETYISASTVPESFKQVIRGIFEKGVTVWKDPKDIGVIDWADNTALPGISY